MSNLDFELGTAFPDVIDNTAREQFSTCPMRFKYSSIWKLTPARTSIHLHAGGAYAAGLEAMRKAFYDCHVSEADALATGIEALVRFYGDYEPEEKDLKTCERMVMALISYVDQYPLATDIVRPLQLPNGKHAVEFTFAIPIDVTHPTTGNPILYAGRYDFLGVRDGSLFVVDDKTTSRLGATWAAQWDLNSQFTGYCWAAKQFDYPVVGAIIRGQSILKTGTEHAQAIIYRPDWQIERWYENLCRNVERAIAAWHTGTYDYALGASCSAYSGCEFKKLCLSQNPTNWIPGNYVQRHWNPLAKDPEAA